MVLTQGPWFTLDIYVILLGCPTKYHRLSDSKSRDLSPHRSRGRTSKIKGSTGMFSPDASFFGVQMATFSLHPHVAFPLGVSLVFLPLLIRTLAVLDGSPTYISFIYLFKDPTSKHSHSLRSWGLGLQHLILEGTQPSCNRILIALCT